MNRTEAQRLAAAINALRPDWPTKSLMTLIETELYQRSYRDAVVALAWIATDPTSRTPKRVAEAGPWWHATPSSTQPVQRFTRDEVCRDCGEPRQRCQRLYASDHDFAPLSAYGADTTTGELPPRTDHSAGAAAVRAAMARPQTPTPDPESVTSTQGAPL